VAHGNAEIAVSENGLRQGFTNPLPVGLIFDPSRIPNPTTGARAGTQSQLSGARGHVFRPAPSRQTATSFLRV
jgi:hypothetical protein